MKHILIIEDDPASATLMGAYMKEANYPFAIADGAHYALEKIKEDSPDLIFLDLGLPDMDGLELLKKIKTLSPHSEVHILTGHESSNMAVECLNAGAKNYLLKPVTPERLYVCIENAFERIDLNRQLAELKGQKTEDQSFYGLVGRSSIIRPLYKAIENVSNIPENVLIFGENGAGRTLVAQAIHKASSRGAEPFIKQNCTAFTNGQPKEALLSLIKETGQGTLFLHNIDHLAPNAQADLFILLEDELDARVICSCSTHPLEAVKIGALREDLYYRINILPIDIPALRARAQDIQLLARYFLERESEAAQKGYQNFDSTTLQVFADYHWPGNVRELENMVKAIVHMQPDGDIVTSSMLPAHMAELNITEDVDATEPSAGLAIFADTVIPMRDLEKMAINHALETHNGNVQKAALELKISPATLYRKKPQS